MLALCSWKHVLSKAALVCWRVCTCTEVVVVVVGGGGGRRLEVVEVESRCSLPHLDHAFATVGACACSPLPLLSADADMAHAKRVA
jgi:hypothetical protein